MTKIEMDKTKVMVITMVHLMEDLKSVRVHRRGLERSEMILRIMRAEMVEMIKEKVELAKTMLVSHMNIPKLYPKDSEI